MSNTPSTPQRIRTHTLRALVCAALVTPLLGGCFFGALAGITAGSFAASDRRTVGIQVEDRSIQLKAGSAIRERLGDSAHINVTTYNRQVLLTGEAADQDTRNRAEAAAAGVANVRLLVNDIQVGPNAPFSSRSSDALITTKVKASLLDAQDIFANSFKIVTEAGVVYIMGLVTEREANRAAAIASGVSGVVKVVKVVDQISEAELSRMTTMPNTGSSAPITTPAAAEPVPQ